MKGFKTAATEGVVSGIDVFMSLKGDYNMITQDHMKEMKNSSSFPSPEGTM